MVVVRVGGIPFRRASLTDLKALLSLERLPKRLPLLGDPMVRRGLKLANMMNIYGKHASMGIVNPIVFIVYCPALKEKKRTMGAVIFDHSLVTLKENGFQRPKDFVLEWLPS